jgi:hypothetical protein
LISPAVNKNNRELILTNRPPFAFIVSGIQTIGVLSKQESIGMAVDMLRKKSIDEVIMIHEKNPDLRDLRIPGFKVLSKKELVDMIEKGYRNGFKGGRKLPTSVVEMNFPFEINTD